MGLQCLLTVSALFAKTENKFWQIVLTQLINTADSKTYFQYHKSSTTFQTSETYVCPKFNNLSWLLNRWSRTQSTIFQSCQALPFEFCETFTHFEIQNIFEALVYATWGQLLCHRGTTWWLQTDLPLVVSI